MSFQPIFDALEAMQIWRALGYSPDHINLNLKQRWYDEAGLVAEEEFKDYCRLRACESLESYRRCRHDRPTLAQICLRHYREWKEELK